MPIPFGVTHTFPKQASWLLNRLARSCHTLPPSSHNVRHHREPQPTCEFQCTIKAWIKRDTPWYCWLIVCHLIGMMIHKGKHGLQVVPLYANYIFYSSLSLLLSIHTLQYIITYIVNRCMYLCNCYGCWWSGRRPAATTVPSFYLLILHISHIFGYKETTAKTTSLSRRL